MPFSKNEVMRRARIYFNRMNNITQREKSEIILYCKHTVNLIEKIKRDGFIINSAIQSNKFQKEFKNISRIQTASGKMLNNFLHLVGTSRSPSLNLINPSNNHSANFSGDDIAMTILWSYATNGELIGRFFKRFIDFGAIYNSLPASQRRGIINTSPEKITFNTIAYILKRKYNTKLFKDVDMDLRNSISHYSFCFFKTTRNAGIFFYYKPYGSPNKRMKRYNLPRLMITSKKINLLFMAISTTVYPLLK